ncbi:putative cytochrome c oxidase assembly protein [Thermochaetoides thermophila DSM 1495]|uniref:Putative cytochrome c oxidase assembly protein n=1 Tax=Chaetomium thermophilum (strain DSM 1495 / CBS 144.50 / IMI 039719) TaxID=759272 RepID=G0SAP7_CHATD|nr:putative cytochrome c oxidase assembly protein [Thermochaetoides thermophila DSM 1495]EGS19819.1 putative cytochrome c oxidase assembly protein [Thermochaetoides thermophila DSM 1495]
MAFFQPGLRRAALNLSRASFCGSCMRTTLRTPTTATTTQSKILRLLNNTSKRYSSTQSPLESLSSKVRKPSATKAQSSSNSGSSKGPKSWPETNDKVVGYWLVGSAASVFGIVIFGGLTRLTESGLSITEWRPVTGSLPPMSDADWQSEFDKYRASPEFKLLNPHMNLEEFKKIYFMEWFHRLWGRFIGLSFVIPTVYFIARRRVTKRMAGTLVGISGLIGFQGVIGWWMVKSGLRDELFAPGSHPRVSQYRLTAHLATAVVCYSWMLLAGLKVLRTNRYLRDPETALKTFQTLKSPALKGLRISVLALTALISVTLLSGALVAGLDAGLIYNEFPMMGTGLAPPKSELFDPFYSRKEDRSDLIWRNMLENPSLVQLDHRILATTTFFAVCALVLYARTGRVRAAMPKNVKRGVNGLLHLALAQVTLGITTLIYMVPIPLAAAHQAGALALLTGALVVGQRMRVPKSTVALVQKALKAPPKVQAEMISQKLMKNIAEKK